MDTSRRQKKWCAVKREELRGCSNTVDATAGGGEGGVSGVTRNHGHGAYPYLYDKTESEKKNRIISMLSTTIMSSNDN